METVNHAFILIAEDNEDDRLLLDYAFRSERMQNRYAIVPNGLEVIKWLERCNSGTSETTPRPDILVLDLHMPLRDGLEVLEWVRQEPAYYRLPVVILSGLTSPRVVERALELGANNYLFKPGDYSELVRFIHDFDLMNSLHASAV